MILVSTHLITVERSADPSTQDPWEAPTSVVRSKVAEHVRAVISVPGGRGAGGSGSVNDSESVEFILVADPCPLTYLDDVIDEATGTRYSVRWAVPSPGLVGLASVRAGLNTYQGFGQGSEQG